MRKRETRTKIGLLLYLLLIIVLIMAVILYDQYTQGRAARAEATAIQSEGAAYDEAEGNNTGGRTLSTQNDSSGAGTGQVPTKVSGISTAISESTGYEYPEHENNAEIEETNSLALFVSRGTDGFFSRGTGNLFDIIGEEYKITAYTAGNESTGKKPGHPEYGITYSGKRVQENHTVAADLTMLPLGTKVLIEGLDTVFVVEDKGSAVKGKHIDLYIPELKEALKWGVQHRRIIVIEIGGTE